MPSMPAVMVASRDAGWGFALRHIPILPYVRYDKRMATKKTTLNIDEALWRHLKEESARRGKPMSYLVEVALRMLLYKPAIPRALPPLPSWDMGGALVDVSDRRAVYEILDRERNERLYGHLRGTEPSEPKDGSH